MDYQALISDLHLYQHLLALLIGMPRLFILVQVAPFMAGTILTGQLRMTIVFACYLVLHPAIVSSLPDFPGMGIGPISYYAVIILKETLIGLLLGYLAGLLFMAMLATVYASYELWPVTTLIPFSTLTSIDIPLFFAGRVGWLMLIMVLLSGPIVVACLLTDVSLGLINRFASQLNVYILAMPIKSGVAMFLLLFYFMLLMSNTFNMFDNLQLNIEQLRRLLPLESS